MAGRRGSEACKRAAAAADTAAAVVVVVVAAAERRKSDARSSTASETVTSYASGSNDNKNVQRGWPPLGKRADRKAPARRRSTRRRRARAHRERGAESRKAAAVAATAMRREKRAPPLERQRTIMRSPPQLQRRPTPAMRCKARCCGCEWRGA